MNYYQENITIRHVKVKQVQTDEPKLKFFKFFLEIKKVQTKS